MINPVSSAQTTAPVASSPALNSLDPNAFLQLLVAQLKEQDPTSPTDSSQFVSQLATLSSVEQSVQSNAKLEQMLAGSAASQAAMLIGHSVASPDGASAGVVISGGYVNGVLTLDLDSGATIDASKGLTVNN